MDLSDPFNVTILGAPAAPPQATLPNLCSNGNCTKGQVLSSVASKNPYVVPQPALVPTVPYPAITQTTITPNCSTQSHDSAVASTPMPPKPGPSTAIPSTPDPERHSRKCIVCNHPQREEIDRAYLRWAGMYEIAKEFDFEDERLIYRHAHALGLDVLRRRNYRFALDRLIEKAYRASVTGDTVIRAIRASCCLDDDIPWREPAKSANVNYTHQYIHEPFIAPEPLPPENGANALVQILPKFRLN